MIRLNLLIVLLAFACPAAIADDHKGGKGKAEKEMRKEAKKQEHEVLKQERKARKDREESEPERRKDQQAQERESRSEDGREKAMAERNQEDSNRDTAIEKTKAKPWWRFW